MIRRMLPPQNKPTAEKLKIDEGQIYPTWIVQNRNFFTDQANFLTAEKAKMLKLVRIANGVFDSGSYGYVENPFNAKDKKNTQQPAKLRNYDIINPIIDRFMGERRQLPSGLSVYSVNAGNVSEYKEHQQKQFEEGLVNEFVNELQALGLPVTPDNPEMGLHEAKAKALNWNDRRASIGQHAYNYIAANSRLDEKYQRAYWWWLVLGRVMTMKNVNHNDVEYKIINPMDISVVGWDENSRYAEDAVAIVRRMKWSVASIIDHFREDLKEEDIEWLRKLESQRTAVDYFGIIGNNWVRTPAGNYGQYEDGTILVEHITWKTMTLRGILHYQSSITGKVEMMPVDETYVLDPLHGDIKIDWSWENEIWEIWDIAEDLNMENTNGRVIYLKYGPHEVQRTELSNTSVCKHPYNGTYWGYNAHNVHSVVEKGLPYQELYNIFHFYFEKSLAKNKDKLMLFPLGLIPKAKGWNTERWMHSIHNFSIAFFDETQEKALGALQAMKEIDMSLSQFMGRMWEFMRAIKEEWWEAIGFNAQRYGDISTSAGKGTTNQALVRSAISSLEMLQLFEDFRLVEAVGLIDYSKYAWIEGKKGQYNNSDSTTVYFEINGIEHAETEYGIQAKSSALEQDKIDFVRNNLLLPLAQNGLDGATIAEVIDATDMTKIKELLSKGQEIVKQFELQKQQMQIDGQKEVEGIKLQTEQMKDQRERDLAKLKADTQIEVALITSDSFNAAAPDNADTDGLQPSDEIVQRHLERMRAASDSAETRRSNMANEQLKREEIQSKERIAKAKPKPKTK